jgi:SRSO17 transposase
LPADATLKALAVAIKARWIYERAHQQLKEELCLDHFEVDPRPAYIDTP